MQVVGSSRSQFRQELVRYGAVILNGQWIGRYSGTHAGVLVIELDDLGTHYEGFARTYDDDETLPNTFAAIRTAGKDKALKQRLELYPINSHTGQPSDWNAIATRYPPDTVFPNNAEVLLETTEDTLRVEWITNIGTSGSAEIARTKAKAPTSYQPITNVSCWEQFKTYVNSLEYRRYVFRGQEQRWRLRSSFHRTGRADLRRFLADDIPNLHRSLSLRTTHIFDLSVPDQNGAFFNLVQHHGYPTPLLDWTFSPFVAAFFAYHKLKNSEARAATERKIRIFIFDQKAWKKDFEQLSTVTWSKPHFSVLEFIPIDNLRVLPQQSISTLTTVDDIEAHIQSSEDAKRQYLRIIDLPVHERPTVMRELSIMGITAGSLFPGLDGACEELKERFFDL